MVLRLTLAAFTLMAVASCASTRSHDASPTLEAPALVISGNDPALKISGLRPGETATVHALRIGTTTRTQNGATTQVPVTAHAWARFKADRTGDVDVSSAVPLSGSYSGADYNGLFWSGFADHDPALQGILPAAEIAQSALQRGDVRLALERDGALVARHTLNLRSFSNQIAFTTLSVSDPMADGRVTGVAGVFAAPRGALGLPSLILLHGSEGFNAAQAQAWAGRMAERGFAALALAYVAYPWAQSVPGVSEVFINIPVETIAKARDALAQRPEADVSRLGVYGISKGAEFSLVAASRYSWIRAVVACVPSDVVWSGFGGAAPVGVENSSWSWMGTPLPAIPYDRYEESFSGAVTATQVHRRSRALMTAEQIERARIPVERIEADVLLIGAGADETWPSLEMAQSIEAQMENAGRGRSVRTLLYPLSSHGSCGTGTALQRIDPEGDPAAIARANTQSFQETISFLRTALR
jgi:dienelactone hydrolase